MLCCLNQIPQGVVLSKNEIVDFVWDGEPISESSLLQLVYCTRRNLADKNIRIISIRGVGYALVEGENAIYVCAN
ncbi:winged helix-turn-helix domain-containing protein [Vibrio mediterranei]